MAAQSYRIARIAFASFALGVLTPCACAESAGRLERRAIEQALDDLKAALDGRWSYRHANRADFDSAIAALREKAVDAMSVDGLGVEIHKIVALGVDGHSGVVGYKLPGSRYLPFLVEPDGQGRFVGSRPREEPRGR